jgi:hypothetical protein
VRRSRAKRTAERAVTPAASGGRRRRGRFPPRARRSPSGVREAGFPFVEGVC